MQTFEIRHDYYSGPMEKLLALVQERQLEISRVNLAAVTADFIAYVEQLGATADSALLSDFVVVAARLLVIKSKELVPTLQLTDEEESSIIDLEHRLQLYREFKHAGELLKGLWNKKTPLHVRPFLSGMSDYSVFYPSTQITSETLLGRMSNLLSIMEGLAPLESKTVSGAMVTLQQKMQELTERLQNQITVTLKGRVSRSDRQEIVVLFLAVLHLLANRLASVEQEDQFGDIVVSRANEEMPPVVGAV